MRILPLTALTVSVLVVLSGCQPKGTSDDANAGTSAPRQAAADVEPQRISLTAEELAQAFKEDREAANERFLNKEVEVKGVVQSVGAFSYPGGYIYLAGIKWETEHKRPWEVVLPGQMITVSGLFEVGGVMMKINDVSDDRLVVSAADLAKQMQADAVATQEKFQGRWLEIQGEVVKLETLEAEPVQIFLAGHEGVRVQCRMSYEQNKFGEALKTGDQVRFAGYFAKPETEGEPLILSCFGIEN